MKASFSRSAAALPERTDEPGGRKAPRQVYDGVPAHAHASAGVDHVELRETRRQIEAAGGDALRADRDARDAPTAIEDAEPRGERLTDFTLGVVERAGDGASRARGGDGQ